MTTQTTPSRSYKMLFEMINSGELTIEDAKDELRKGWLPADASELVAGWLVEKLDQQTRDRWEAEDAAYRATFANRTEV